MAITFNNLTNSNKIAEINTTLENHEGRITTLESAGGGGSKLYRHTVQVKYDRGDGSSAYTKIPIISTRSTPYSTDYASDFISDVASIYGLEVYFYTLTLPILVSANHTILTSSSFYIRSGYIDVVSTRINFENGALGTYATKMTTVGQYNSSFVEDDTVTPL